jgi:hypothetical protein
LSSLFRRFSALSVVPATLLATLLFAPPTPAGAASLTPSRPGLLRQVRAARAHDYTYLRDDRHVRYFVDRGWLVHLPGNRNYRVKQGTPNQYARPEVRLFVERLSSQYRSACGEQLVVTSLVRPKTRQPRNSSPLSVHPTGMAMDLRISQRGECRRWLESALLGLEASGVLEAARERRPPHYHVVLFPHQYTTYVEARNGRGATASVRTAHALAESGAATPDGSVVDYRVRRGDSLWTIARSHNTTVDSIRRANNLRSNQIKPRQILKVPVRAR